ncbi:uncharacterized MFS-type transporter C09D4.1-like [Chrysoperla carnea]|uniref:uncharacterized MFS-type transporter C09D4.1-like n=1 Tax=Chrysoperla carnea TaxID=189513 RepID=UPI001D06C7AF|nr:uncharacterized MFS-type transporter C09D4.1-like [Chrysoperla carnea]
MVNMTSVVYLLPYLPLIVPASYVIDKKGIRFTLLLAASGNFIGSLLKVFSAHPNLFFLGLFGQTISSVAQVFLLSMPPKLAGIWFDANQISLACTIGILASELGIGASFLFTPIVVRDHANMNEIGNDLFMLFLIVGIATFTILVLTILFFQEEPLTPPSEAQKLKSQESSNTIKSFKALLINPPFVMLMFAFAINIGILNSVNSLLNPILLLHFQTNGERLAGNVGVICVVFGVLGCFIFGILLDKTKKFKELSVIVYVMSVIGMLAFTFAVASENKIFIYLSAMVYGFSSSYLVVGCETGVELTYPESEFNSSGLLFGISFTTGGIFTLLFTFILETTSDFWSNMVMVILLTIGTVLTICTRNVCKRQDALRPYNLNENVNQKIEKF